jgi:hypothetical protein
VTRLSIGTKVFDIVILTLVFDLLIQNFNLGNIFWLVNTKAWHLTWVILVTRTFLGYQNVLKHFKLQDHIAWYTWSYDLKVLWWLLLSLKQYCIDHWLGNASYLKFSRAHFIDHWLGNASYIKFSRAHYVPLAELLFRYPVDVTITGDRAAN